MTIALCSLAYRRGSRWNGAACRPVVLLLEDGRLGCTGRDGHAVLDAALTDVRVRVPDLASIVVTADGIEHHIVGRGALVSPAHSDAQREVVRDFEARHRLTSPADPTFLDVLVNGASAWRMEPWRDALDAAGVPID